jgi:hypothetical protein
LVWRPTNGRGQELGFPTGQDSATFWDKGTEVSALSRDKGTTGQAKNLAKGRDGPGQPKSGLGRGTKWLRSKNDVLKQENDVQKQDKFHTLNQDFFFSNFPYNFCGDFRQHVIPMIITCTLQGTPCDTGFPAHFMGGKFAVYGMAY